MNKHLGPIEVRCDAPPYAIVRGCRQIGVRSPEDVRWYRLSHFFLEHSKEHPMVLFRLLGMGQRVGPPVCTCRENLPDLDRVVFTLSSGTQVSYLIGQCSRCRTVFWEEA